MSAARRHLSLLVLAGCAYAIAQLLLFDPSRPPEFDESVYLSQVMRGVPGALFAEHRARGMTVLVAPLASIGAPLVAIRLFLVAVSGALLVAAFWPWTHLVGRVATVAAALFGGTWLALYYGSEIMPNLHVAFGAVAMVGLSWRATTVRPPRAVLPLLALVTAWTTLVRPTDATVVAVGAVVTLVLCRERLGGVVAALGGGLVAGWAPWVLEAFIRFGGPLQRLRTASDLVEGADGFLLLEHLRLTDGPLVGGAPQPVPWQGTVWWAALALLAVLGVVLARGVERRALAGALVAAAPLLLVYAVTGALAPRFLLPVYALLSLPAAAGVLRAAPLDAGGLRVGVMSFLLAALLFWHVQTAASIARSRAPERERVHDIGVALRDVADGEQCRFATPYSRPQIQVASGCFGVQYQPSGTAEPFDATPYPGRSYVLVPSAVGPSSAVASWPRRSLPHGWVLYEAP